MILFKREVNVLENDTLLLVSEKLQEIQKSVQSEDISKSKSNRDGLIQQIITYVRDGRTITRKQWVRSTFAEHAKKNEEQKRKQLAEQKKRKDDTRKRTLEEENEKKRNADKRQYKKVKKRGEELEEQGSKGKVKDIHGEAMKERLAKLKESNEKKEKENKKDKNTSDSKKDKDKKHKQFGSKDYARESTKTEQKMIQT